MNIVSPGLLFPFHQSQVLFFFLGFSGITECANDGFTSAQISEFGTNPMSDQQTRSSGRLINDQNTNIQTIPTNFNSILHWYYCPSIAIIAEQSKCDASYALSTASAISDRLCISSRGHVKVFFSGFEIVSCCRDCTNNSNKCMGGSAKKSWEFWEQEGLVSGSNFTSNDGCKPWPYPHCKERTSSHRIEKNNLYKVPSCEQECVPAYTSMTYTAEKKRFRGHHVKLIENKPTAIQQEVLNFGPVTMDMDLYENFLIFKGGVYKKSEGRIIGKLTVKLVGWGKENDGTDFWLCASTFDQNFGEKGFFRIQKGTNFCNIESHVLAGHPKPAP